MPAITSATVSDASLLASQNALLNNATELNPALEQEMLKASSLVNTSQLTALDPGVLSNEPDTLGTKNFKFVGTEFNSNLLKSLETSVGGTTPPASTGGTDPLSSFNSSIGSLNSQLQSAMSDLQGLDPNDPQYLQKSTADAMKIQQLQQQIQEMVTLMSDTLKSQHDDLMAIEGNMKQ